MHFDGQSVTLCSMSPFNGWSVSSSQAGPPDVKVVFKQSNGQWVSIHVYWSATYSKFVAVTDDGGPGE